MARWTTSQIPDLAGRTAIVTGANSGLGFESAKALAQHGAEVVLACRNDERCRQAANRIRAEARDARLVPMTLDLADLDSVRAFAEEFANSGRKLHILMNNAGVMATPTRMTTKQGFELQFGTNHLGHFALTGLLMPTLLVTPEARIVTVSSFASDSGSIDFGDLQLEHGYAPYRAYSASKLANLLFMLELDRRLKWAGCTIVSVGAHPGFSSTMLQATGPFLGRPHVASWLVLAGVRLMGQSAAHGAEGQLYAATAPGVEGGQYFGPKNRIRGAVGATAMTGRARDEAVAARLWEVSQALTGVDFDSAISCP
jgi:NAD(P)-dependent dehydrogenase (short-subunit alcohol dehydrogenase family)